MRERIVAGLLAGGLVVVGGAAVAAEGGRTERVSVRTGGGQANFGSRETAISGDGRFVAFTSEATNLVPGDTNAVEDVFVRDRRTGRTERVNVGRDGAQAEFSGGNVAISAGGRFVAFDSSGITGAADPATATIDVFVRDRQAGTTERVSVGPGGAAANGSSYRPSLSRDGRYVAFESGASNLVAGDTNGTSDIFVRDRQRGTTERVSVRSDGGQATGIFGSGVPDISADGRFVAFASGAVNLFEGDTNDAEDVFVHDRKTGRTELVSVGPGGAEGDDQSFYPSISADGRHVAFSSAARNLVPGDTNDRGDVFVRDRVAGTTERVSVGPDGAQSGSGGLPSISADGRFVAFISPAADLVAGDTNGVADVFVRDRVVGKTERASVGQGGVQAGRNSSGSLDASISADGRHVAFRTTAANLVPGDTNKKRDIFVRTR